MAGHSSVDESQFKGWQKHFNTYTIRGRSNVSILFIFFLIKIPLHLSVFFIEIKN